MLVSQVLSPLENSAAAREGTQVRRRMRSHNIKSSTGLRASPDQPREPKMTVCSALGGRDVPAATQDRGQCGGRTGCSEVRPQTGTRGRRGQGENNGATPQRSRCAAAPRSRYRTTRARTSDKVTNYLFLLFLV